MKYYALCPICGKKLCRAEIGSVIEMPCPHCKLQVEVAIDKSGISISMSKETKQNNNK